MPPTIIRDASTAAGITREGNYVLQTLAEKAPNGFDWLRNRLLDGMTGAGAAAASERNDGQIGQFPLNADRWVVWDERFPELATTSADRWQVVGAEVHGPNVSAFPQALLMLEISPSKRRRLNANAGRPLPRYFDIGPIELGRSYRMKMHVRLSAGADGLIRIWRDGVLVVEVKGPTIDQAIAGSYWKEANYRGAGINGPTTHDFAGLRIYDGDPDLTPAPPPSPTDTLPPVLSMARPIAGGEYALNAIPVIADAQDVAALGVDPSGIAEAYVGVVGDGGAWEVSQKLTQPGPYSLVLDATKAQRGTAVPGGGHVYFTAADKVGNQFTSEGFQIVLVDLVPPPPPVDPCAGVRVDLEATAAARDALALKLAEMRSGVAAETQRHAAAVAAALED